MVNLSQDELASIHAVLHGDAPSRSSTPGVSSYSLIREPADVGRVIDELADRAHAVVETVELILSSRTHGPWTVRAGAPRSVSLAELASAMPNPVIAMWESTTGAAAFIVLETRSAHRLIAAVLGVPGPDPAAAGSDALGVLDRRVAARVLGALREAVVRAGFDATDTVQLSMDWRSAAARLAGPTCLTLPLELEAPIQAGLDLVLTVPPTAEDARAPAAPTVAAHLPALGVEVSAELGAARCTLEELRCLAPGSVLTLDAVESDPVTVLLEGIPRYSARIETVAGRLALRVVARSSESRGSADSP